MGVKAPVERTGEDLDPTTIFHVCQDFDMIRFSNSFVRGQVLKWLVIKNGSTWPICPDHFVKIKKIP